MNTGIYQLKITLLDSKPKIWRRIEVPGDILLSDFHKILQTTMGWTNSHLHQFIDNDTFYTVRYPGDDTWEEMNNVDYKGIRLDRLLPEVTRSIIYEYDFGDSWEHEILLEKITKPVKGRQYPICIAGKMNCPPEDIGGIDGYIEMLRVLKNPRHPEYEGFIDWLGEFFDYREFDIEKVNMKLAKRNFGMYSPRYH